MSEGVRDKRPLFQVFWTALRLGSTSFGGPIAHLGYFRREYVERKKWISEEEYADLVALCQFLPGPASSQVGIGIGIKRAGSLGGLFAWLGFTLPSALIMLLVAYFFSQGIFQKGGATEGILHGLMIAAAAVVTQAVWGMGKGLAPDAPRRAIAILSAVVILLWPAAIWQILVILGAGLIGLVAIKGDQGRDDRDQGQGDRQMKRQESIPPLEQTDRARSHRFGKASLSLSLFFFLLLLLPLLHLSFQTRWIALVDTFYRVGSLVFGGGHVVLPLLEAEVVPGWLTPEAFLTGYGVAQAVPGPLFTFSAYIGYMAGGFGWGALALVAMFLPSFLLVEGVLPFWARIRENPRLKGIFQGVQASVVGVLLAALYDPVWIKAIGTPYDFAFYLILTALLMLWKLPPVLLVLLSIAGGVLLSLVGS